MRQLSIAPPLSIPGALDARGCERAATTRLAGPAQERKVSAGLRKNERKKAFFFSILYFFKFFYKNNTLNTNFTKMGTWRVLISR